MPFQVSTGMRQLELAKHSGWGGARRGAGRKPRGEKALVSHARRPTVRTARPLHITLRVLPHVWNLRAKRTFSIVARALTEAQAVDGFRVVDFSVQGNHIHLLVEGDNRRAVSPGMQGFCIRVARALNVLMGRRGRVFADRFHTRELKTPTEIENVVRYVRNNRDVHATRAGRAVAEAFSSAARDNALLVSLADGYLLTRALRRVVDGAAPGDSPRRARGRPSPRRRG